MNNCVFKFFTYTIMVLSSSYYFDIIGYDRSSRAIYLKIILPSHQLFTKFPFVSQLYLFKKGANICTKEKNHRL